MDRTVQHAFDPQEIMAYLDGELEPQRAAALAGHLVDCAECQEIAKGFRSISERLMDFEVEPAASQIGVAIQEAVDRSEYFPKKIQPDKWQKRYTGWGDLLAKRYVLGFAGALAMLAILIVGVSKTFEYKVGTAPRFAPLPRSESIATVFRKENAEQREENGVAGVLGGVADGGGSGSGSAPAPPLPALGELQAPETVGPMIAQTASLTIVAKNYDEASAAIERMASERGGYVERLDARAQTGNARALSASLRIPAKELDGFLKDARKLGHVDEESRSNEEVSAQYVDLQARLHSAQATEKRLLELLGNRTGRLSDVLDAERELARVRSEIERMQAQNAILIHRVSYATVQVELSEEYRERLGTETSNGTRVWNALVDGFGNLESGVVAGLAFLLAYGPSILFWLGVILVPIWLVWKRLRRRQT